METSKLKSLGLTDNEALIYSTLLEIGPKPAGTISRRTKLHRRVIYDTTERLIGKGLLGYIIENGKKIFSASNPNKFLEIEKERENKIEEILPEMLDLFNSTKEKHGGDTLFFKGKEGLKSVFEDQLADKKEILIIGASEMAYESLEFYFHWFDKRRVKEKIKTKIIFNKDVESKHPKIPLAEVRYLPEKYSSPLAINIYGEKIAIILWSKISPFAIVIKQKEIADGYRKHFDMIWKSAKN
ncbi:MAG: helix-turn-helix domain-containing protein [archaeon]